MGENCWHGEPPTMRSTPPLGADSRTCRSGSAPPSSRCQTSAQARLTHSRGPRRLSLRHRSTTAVA
eukprot:3410331-Alexandrium_andersonii.AAC.1